MSIVEDMKDSDYDFMREKIISTKHVDNYK
jgi:hypothetical protein